MKQAHGLIEGLQAQYVLADKAYDADCLIQTIHDNNAKACIPPKTNRLEQRAYDKDLYRSASARTYVRQTHQNMDTSKNGVLGEYRGEFYNRLSGQAS